MKTTAAALATIALTIAAAPIAIAHQTGKSSPSSSTMPAPNIETMQQHMQKMHAQLEQLQKTTDPAQRRKLLQQHMDQMNQAMVQMHEMGGPMMGEGHMGGNQRMGPMGGNGPADQRMQMMESRMDMMQLMMEQMHGHMAQMQGPGARPQK